MMYCLPVILHFSLPSVTELCCALQGMAGNIIHAIATTNAIVGGLIVIEAMKLLAGAPEHSKVSLCT